MDFISASATNEEHHILYKQLATALPLPPEPMRNDHTASLHVVPASKPFQLGLRREQAIAVPSMVGSRAEALRSLRPRPGDEMHYHPGSFGAQ